MAPQSALAGVLGRDVHPGQQFQVAIFAINGPLSTRPPTTSGCARPRSTSTARRRQPGGRGDRARRPGVSTASWPADARVEKVATGFGFTEGPVWDTAAGYLLFSDPNENTIYRWSPDDGGLRLPRQQRLHRRRHRRLRPAGLERPHARREGRLTICEHGNRRVTRLERNGVADGARRQLPRASGSTARTTSSTARTAPSTSPTRRSACRSSSTTRGRSCPTPASSPGRTASCGC